MRLLLKLLAAPVVLALALFIWICFRLLYCSAFLFGLAGTIVGLLGGTGHLLGPERHHSSGDCLPGEPDGSAYGGGVAAGQAPGPALCHPGSGVWITNELR